MPPGDLRIGNPGSSFRILELFCGIGGCSQALADTAAEVVGAIDINHRAVFVYRRNFPHPVSILNLEFLTARRLEEFQADLWWLSPPCQPFSRRGRRRDDEDPRSRALLHLTALLPEALPHYFALENVPGFEESRTHARLLEVLRRAGYEVRERLLCPTELGIPNRRRRYYLLASLDGLEAEDRGPESKAPAKRIPLVRYLDPLTDIEADAGLALDPHLARRYEGALHVVDGRDPKAVTACFTSAYGRSPVLSGSFLQTGNGLRHFSPREVLNLLGFPETYRLPNDLPRTLAWRLIGNSLSLPPVRHILQGIPALRP